jgi:hypothetical protein
MALFDRYEDRFDIVSAEICSTRVSEHTQLCQLLKLHHPGTDVLIYPPVVLTSVLPQLADIMRLFTRLSECKLINCTMHVYSEDLLDLILQIHDNSLNIAHSDGMTLKIRRNTLDFIDGHNTKLGTVITTPERLKQTMVLCSTPVLVAKLYIECLRKWTGKGFYMIVNDETILEFCHRMFGVASDVCRKEYADRNRGNSVASDVCRHEYADTRIKCTTPELATFLYMYRKYLKYYVV